MQNHEHGKLVDCKHLGVQHSLWQQSKMIEFRGLADDHSDLAHSPLLRGALLTLQYAHEHGSIGLTKTKAFKRVFVHWAVEHFDWPGKSAEEMFRYNKIINEYEFPPLEVLHFLLIALRLGRHYKGEFRLTKRGTELAQAPGRLFAELIPYFVFQIDHATYARFDERPFGKWDVWMNVINVEADQGTTEAALFESFYGAPQDWHTAGWREMAAFSSCVLRPLEWAGLLIEIREVSACVMCSRAHSGVARLHLKPIPCCGRFLFNKCANHDAQNPQSLPALSGL